MQALWRISSRHMALPFLVLALLLIASQFARVHADRDKGTFYLKDMEGNRSALSDVTISGELGEGFFATSFRLVHGKVMTDTRVYDPPRTIWYDTRTPDKLKGSIQYEFMPVEPITISYRDLENLYDYKTATINPPFIEYNDKHQISHGHSLTNYGEYGLAIIGKEVFAVVPSTKRYVGATGIYKLKFMDAPNSTGETPESKALVTFSLDKNNEPGHSIEVLGLEAVGDKLALILEEDKKLVIRSYDSESGNLLGDVAVKLPVPRGELDTAYEAFTNESNNQLSIAMITASEKDVTQKTIWSFDLSDGVKMSNETMISYDNGIEINKRNLKSISYQNGKLYVVYKHFDLEGKTDREKLFEPALPLELIIQVYEQSKLLYEGELVTDRNDDTIKAINYSDGVFNIDTSEDRAFEHIAIQSAQ